MQSKHAIVFFVELFNEQCCSCFSPPEVTVHYKLLNRQRGTAEDQFE